MRGNLCGLQTGSGSVTGGRTLDGKDAFQSCGVLQEVVRIDVRPQRTRSGTDGVPEFHGQEHGWVWSDQRLPTTLEK